DFIDSLAFTVSRGGIPWAQAKMVLGERYSATHDAERAVSEFAGLIRAEPSVAVGWLLTAKALLAAGQMQRAEPYLEKAYDLKPSGFAAYGLGVLAMQRKNLPRATTLFENALQLTADMPPALYQLSLAYALQRDLGRARAYAARLAQVAPSYPGLGELMVSLGMPGR
ncbi:MAG TPA: tetratricopeptide repeat protein, partial [Gemmatimonadaceae bacterium]|nr:tetratricopeptide repeat protein [Gemmatimonadaceae bacterium]